MAKLADDNWATALAWRQQTANSSISPVTYGDADQALESSATDRWRSARATARQARRNSSSGGGDGVAVAAASVAYRNQRPVSSRSPVGRSGAAGGGSVGGGAVGGVGWERRAVVVVGDGPEGLSEEEEESATTTTVVSGRQSGGFAL